MKSSSTESPDKTHVGIPAPPGNGRKPQSGNDMIQLSHGSKGILRIEHPRPGMFLSLTNHVPAEDTVAPYKMVSKGIAFTVNLGRHPRMNKVPPPCDGILRFDACSGEWRYQGGVPHRFVGIMLQGELLERLVKGSGRFGMSIVESLEKGRGAISLDKRPSSPETSLLARQILNCPMTGQCRDLYLEAKALEMIALFLHRMADTRPRSAISLSRSDVERIHAARDILLKDVAEPPSLNQLARQAGLNEFKLKKGFREVFNCTVYEALRMERLNMAHTLLRDSDMTVGNVAAMVGYTNLGHFIALFRKHFGVTPGSLLQQTRHSAVHEL